MNAPDLTYGWHPIALLALGSAVGQRPVSLQARRPSQPPVPARTAAASEPEPEPESAPLSLPPGPRTLRSAELLGPVSERTAASQRARGAALAVLQP